MMSLIYVLGEHTTRAGLTEALTKLNMKLASQDGRLVNIHVEEDVDQAKAKLKETGLFEIFVAEVSRIKPS